VRENNARSLGASSALELARVAVGDSITAADRSPVEETRLVAHLRDGQYWNAFSLVRDLHA